MVTLIMGWIYLLIICAFIVLCFWDWDRLDRIEDKEDITDDDIDLL